MGKPIKNNNFGDDDKDIINQALELNSKCKYHVALALLLSIQEKYKESSVLNGLIATTYSYLKDSENSTKYFIKTANLNPNSELASLGMFQGLFDKGEYEDAYNEMDRFLGLNEPKHYIITLEELYEQLDEHTPEYQKRIVEKHFEKYINPSLEDPKK